MPPKRDAILDEDNLEQHIRISFSDMERSMTTFTGDDTYPIAIFIEEFEDVAEMMHWTNIEKLIYAKRLLNGTAKLFLRTLGRVKDYSTLKKALMGEFGPKMNSATIHKRLASRKMQNNETLQQYFLIMKELAFHGNVEDSALIDYVIDGIQDVETNKIMLYGASDIADFRRRLALYSDFRSKMPMKQNYSTRAAIQGILCFSCGERNHISASCPYQSQGRRCFNCQNFGHIATNCHLQKMATKTLTTKPRAITSSQMAQQIAGPSRSCYVGNTKEQEQDVCKQNRSYKPFKIINLYGKMENALIDSGCDVNLMSDELYNELKLSQCDASSNIVLTGLGSKEIITLGSVIIKLVIDDCLYTNVIFYIISRYSMPFRVILDGNVRLMPKNVDWLNILMCNCDVASCDFPCLIHINDVHLRSKTQYLVETYQPLQIKEAPIQMKIILKDDIPVKFTPRRISLTEQAEVEKQIDDWLQKGIIRVSHSEYASPLVLVRKKDGSIRVCIDYRKLNQKMFKDEKAGDIYQIGDIVAIKRTQFGTCLKLKAKYLGPYRVVKVKRNDRYDVEKVDPCDEGPNRTSTAVDYMKRWPDY
ncbi:hypothetical protein K1T71_012888 [Dendrolimus kikuchii]|uniref:Uncharacterized protein n=1 Tax=Dendrolimus kikuchii TaxID=765133 RepID=A0ACC1CIC9_9NEOP|nr:hypothetical protein K1T71_012888 [Dendrolimus kikuchii]